MLDVNGKVNREKIQILAFSTGKSIFAFSTRKSLLTHTVPWCKGGIVKANKLETNLSVDGNLYSITIQARILQLQSTVKRFCFDLGLDLED